MRYFFRPPPFSLSISLSLSLTFLLLVLPSPFFSHLRRFSSLSISSSIFFLNLPNFNFYVSDMPKFFFLSFKVCSPLPCFRRTRINKDIEGNQKMNLYHVFDFFVGFTL
ncbi:hypothetical protein I3760_01G114300 [Carya illinoinensis]|nr:hypothetical protein I3760_01G114300 [Carya illinoinensis]